MPETTVSAIKVMTAAAGNTAIFMYFQIFYRDSLSFYFVNLLELAQVSFGNMLINVKLAKYVKIDNFLGGELRGQFPLF